ncbi:unnamed protein product [Paramecium octaurelia]|uniref:Uncharacterized protein n=1 Tax=Paramecium octaurelia TaxID=43137 RepID=A0A8S1YG26_PAROT|nr:unnamed protein product [Paramecium octaurelia]
MQIKSALLFMLVVQSWQSEENACVCGHLSNQEQCAKSSICQWDGNVCVLKEASYITTQSQLDPSNCKIYPQEKCNTLEKCGFYLNMCTEFKDCGVFQKDQCSESSYRCVSDGEKCVEVKECEDYLTNVACQNKNIHGKYCSWGISITPNCQEIKDCTFLPEYFKSDQECREALSYCTVSKKSQGCQESGENCVDHQNENQCITNRSQTTKCYWDTITLLCKELKCENITGYTDESCKKILPECTTNGKTCTERKQCEDAQSIEGCITDEKNNKCAYYNKACMIKTCSTASSQYSNYYLCQGYDDKLDCVSVKGGGCKKRPTACEDFEQQIDCDLQVSLGCIWYGDQCLVKECQYAPSKYNQSECKTFGQCIGKTGGGCQDWPETCDLILEQEFCEFDKEGNWCRWSDGKCLQLICTNFKYPNYDSHSKCQLLSKKCTYSAQFGSCVDYLCETVTDDMPCVKDYNNNKCIKRFGCTEKQCSKAPATLNTNLLCEGWLANCTVNILVFGSVKSIRGCTKKKAQCNDYFDQQCFTTNTGEKCKWSSNKCIPKSCSDADITLVTNEDCLKYKPQGAAVPCILKVAGAGCQDWPTVCSSLGNEVQCNYGLYNGTTCYWNGRACKDRSCSNAIDTVNSNILCVQFNPICILDSDQLGCKLRPSNLLCSDAPDSPLYDSHDKCFAWYNKCTVQPVVGCYQKQTSCSNYLINQCNYTITGQKCKWVSGSCASLNCELKVDTVTLYHSACEAYDINCTVKTPTTCIPLKSNCSQYVEEQSCVINSTYEKCKWNISSQTCSDYTCEMNTTATTESQCFAMRQGFKCQFKMNSDGSFGPGCETRKTSCSGLSSAICNKTVLQDGSKCYYYSSSCTVLGSENCSAIQTGGYYQHHICLYYASYCLGDISGAYDKCQHKYNCASFSSTLCNYIIANYDECMIDPYYYNCRDKLNCSSYPQNQCGYTLNYVSCVWLSSSYYCATSSCSGITSSTDSNCQSMSAMCRYPGTGSYCSYVYYCSDVQTRVSNCAYTVTYYGERCYYDGSKCLTRECPYITSPTTNYDCYKWRRNCTKQPGYSFCVATACHEYTDIYQCLKNSCYYQYGYGCTTYINCKYNSTAVRNYDCELLSPICKLNYRNGQGCEFRSCYDITSSSICDGARNFHWVYCKYVSGCVNMTCSQITSQSICESAYGYFNTAETYVAKCYWCDSMCSYSKTCALGSTQLPVSHAECQYLDPTKTIASDTYKCTLKFNNCSDYHYYRQCEYTITGQKCFWDRNQSPTCFDYCLTKAQAGLTHAQCQAYHSQCVANSASNKCIYLVCSSYTTSLSCNNLTTLCMWDPIDSVCVKYETYLYCHRYSIEADCNAGTNSSNHGCLWNSTSSKCEDRTCSNYVGVPTSLEDCDDWLKNCQFDSTNNVCVADCQSAQKSKQYDTVEECEEYYQDKICTIVPGVKKCQSLFNDCSLYLIDSMCQVDSAYNPCYWSTQQTKCFTLNTCIVLDTYNDTHLKCNALWKNCTVNTSLAGCIELDDCANYTIQDQCVFDKNNIDCQWFQSKCQIKSCSTAPLVLYTPTDCQAYFPKSLCTSNNNSDACFEGHNVCKKYTMDACSLPGQMNSAGIPCFWDLDQSRCREKVCSNAPSNFETTAQCEGFLSNKQCQIIGCKQIECDDFPYRNDETCRIAMENFKCTTNGYECIDRTYCEDATLEDACTFDYQMNECQWFDYPDYQCVQKTCSTAPVEFKTHIECQNYLKGCTNKIEGGCTNLKTCLEIITQDGCKIDINNQECLWDSFFKKCFPNHCQGFCGDGMIQLPLEECDDGNFLPYDGCYDCKIQCPLGCNDCNGKICQKCNELKGYYYNSATQQCQTKCGDKIVNGQEYCDDGNDIEYDGCYECQYSCDIYCVNCYQGECIECPKGFNPNGPYCQSKCGDGILNPIFEECDDGNIKPNDGCDSNCFVESNWKCKVVSSMSECYYLVYPKIVLTLLTKQTEQTQDVKVSFSEKVKLNSTSITPDDFLSQMQILFTNKDSVDFSFNIVPIKPISYELDDASYRITLTIKEQILKPNLQVIIKSIYLVNQFDNTLFIQQEDIILNDSFVVSEDSKSVAANAAFLSQLIIYSVLALAIVSFLSGNLEILFNLIDVLQQLSYIRYININFPYHLDLYFDVFNFVTLQPLLDYVQFNSFLEGSLNLQTPEIFPPGKFNMFGVNAYFGVNFQSFLICMVVGFANYFLAILITYILKKPTLGWGDTPSKISRYFYLLIMKAYQLVFSTAFSYMQYFFFSGLIRIFLSNYYDLTFSALLQVMNFNTESTLLKWSSLLAAVTLLINAFLILIFYASLSKKNVFQKSLYVLVDGLNIGRNKWNKQFNTVTLVKKLCFIYSLVLLQDSPIFQTLLISFISSIFAIYVLLLQPFEHQFENYKIIVTEFCVSFNTCSFLVYCSKEIFYNSEFSNMLGWLNIFMFSLILTFSLALDSYSQILQLKRIFDRMLKPKVLNNQIKIQSTKLFTVVGENEVNF